MSKSLHPIGAVGLTRQAVLALAEGNGEPEWLHSRRLEAWEAYECAPLPKWPYTDARRFALDHVVLHPLPEDPEGAMPHVPEPVRRALVGDPDPQFPVGGALVQVDSLPARTYLGAELARQGVILTDLATALREHPELVQPYLLSRSADFSDRFLALHAALLHGGIFLYVPRGVEVALPLYFVHVLTTPAGATFPHNLVVVDRGASLVFCEEYVSPEGLDRPFVGAYTECYLRDGARLRYTVIQRWGTDVSEVSRRLVVVGRDAQARTTAAFFGGGLMRSVIRAEMAEPGGSSEILCLMLTSDSQHLDVVTENRHVAPHTQGEMATRQVLRDRSRTAFSGMIVIERSAPHSTDYLQEHALVLDPEARCDAIPGLEIMNDEVAATHGATVGQVDEEQLFYLMSRGIPRRVAEHLIVSGFFEPILERVPDPAVAAYLRRLVDAKLRA